MGALEKLAKEKIKLGVLNLPSDVEPQSVDVINALNEQLIEVSGCDVTNDALMTVLSRRFLKIAMFR